MVYRYHFYFLVCFLLMYRTVSSQPMDSVTLRVRMLVDFVIKEHTAVKDSFRVKGVDFKWKFCSFGKFPIEKGTSYPFNDGFDYYKHLQSVDEEMNVIHVDSIYSVGIRYMFVDSVDRIDPWKYVILNYKYINKCWYRIP